MMTHTTIEQRGVAEWFDAVYRRKGARYLRPLEAYLVFPALLDARAEHDFLDVACGLGMLLRAASERTERLHGIDISAVAVDQARRNVAAASVVVGNAEHLPYADGAFDRITCLGSLERMLDKRRALQEMLRVGKADARYCFLVRNSNTLSWRGLARLAARRRARGHAGADTLARWTDLFASQGFRIDAVLPDQYPLQRRERWTSLLRGAIDYRKPLSGGGALERANEFVFVLGKAP